MSSILSLPLTLGACATPALQSGRGFESDSAGDQAAPAFERDHRYATEDLSSLSGPGFSPPQGGAIEGSIPSVVPGTQRSFEPVGAPGATTPLYAWDGGVVEGPTPGAVLERGTPQHGIEPSATGRMHIIELYQTALDERDALIDERTALQAMLAAAQETLLATQASGSTLESKLLELQGNNDALRVELADLAARLVTAQIRRLEAEKLLLESQIQSRRPKPALRSLTEPSRSSTGPESRTQGSPLSADEPPPQGETEP